MLFGPEFSIIAAGVASTIIGYIWYLPKIFGNAWMRMAGITPEMQEAGKRRIIANTIIAFLASTFAAWVMSYVGVFWGVYDIPHALQLGFWCWAGFVATTMLGSVLWDHKPFALYCIHAGYWLVSFMAMAVIMLF